MLITTVKKETIAMNKKQMQAKLRKAALLLDIVLSLLLQACFANVSGKFLAQEGVPQFIKVGQTTRTEVFDKLGEPLVHRFVAGKETAIYDSVRLEFWFIYGTYEGRELVIHFDNQVVSDARVEKTGSGWSCLMPPLYRNPVQPAP